jgi:hypothetical protein
MSLDAALDAADSALRAFRRAALSGRGEAVEHAVDDLAHAAALLARETARLRVECRPGGVDRRRLLALKSTHDSVAPYLDVAALVTDAST